LAQRRQLGSFVGAIDPKRFFGGKAFARVVRSLAESARQQPAADPTEPVLVPGDDRYATEKLRLASGIPIEPGLVVQILDWTARLGVEALPIIPPANRT
jgi:ureidoglycolate dehydrogenase (NAD+)